MDAKMDLPLACYLAWFGKRKHVTVTIAKLEIIWRIEKGEGVKIDGRI